MWETQARFCPNCGGALREVDLDHRARLRCTACAFVLYVNPASASAALVVEAGKILLVKRGIEPFRGYWGLPAGYQEYDETPEQTVIRETLEETGVDVAVVRLFDVLYTRDDPRKRANLIAFLCRPVGGVLRAGDDAIDADFFPLDRLPEEIAFANNRTLLAKIRESVK